MMIERFLKHAVLGIVAGVTLLAATHSAVQAQDKRFKIYLSLSYSGNDWQSEAANIVKALAATPPYNKMVDLKELISGTDPQAQISAYESMIADKADGVISFPVSPTALNRTIKRGCDAGVLFFMYDATVTEPCAYNVSYITAGFGENTAQALVNLLGGKGNIYVNHGVPGNAVDKRHVQCAKTIFEKYPGIHIVAEYYGMWSESTTQQETAKALIAHPDVDGVWSEYGAGGVIKAVLATHREKLFPMTGEDTNGFRLFLLDPKMRALGLTGVSSGSPPATAGYAFKLMMEVLTKKRKLEVHNIEYPLPWWPIDTIKLCLGDKFENGCNTFPRDKVSSDEFPAEAFNPVLLPEITMDGVIKGLPKPGATIQPLPADVVHPAPNTPGINCQNCDPPKDLCAVTKVVPIAVP